MRYISSQIHALLLLHSYHYHYHYYIKQYYQNHTTSFKSLPSLLRNFLQFNYHFCLPPSSKEPFLKP